MSRLAVLQAVRLKGGMADAPTLAALVGLEEGEVQTELAALCSEGLVQERRDRYRLTPEGREPLASALAEERAGVDQAALEGIWRDFSAADSVLKGILADWQLRDGEPNDHSDASYDAAILDRVAEVHAAVAPLAVQIAGLAPRLSRYPRRLDAALAQLQAGDAKWLSNPMCDSYHTVFHELHEELYDLTGKDRASEEAR